MNRTFPLMAVLAASLSAPLATSLMAQDISDILNPGNFAARLNADLPLALSQRSTNMADLTAAARQIALARPSSMAELELALPQVSALAPRSSIAPVPRRGVARSVTTTLIEATPEAGAPTHAAPLVERMAEVSEAAPEGSNTLVINGSNTAVIQSTSSSVASRPSLWQRVFGG